MTKKILTTLVLVPLALIVSGFFVNLGEEPADPVSLVTGCGAIASANPLECRGECKIEHTLCLQTCLPLPDDCSWTPIGPECELYVACRNLCDWEWRQCKMMCG